MTRPSWDGVSVGQELPPRSFVLRRAELVRYAGASGDFNPIHWSDSAARAAGLPDVIAHGMLTMGGATVVVTDWLGDPGAVVECAVRFERPVVVPDSADGTTVDTTATVVEKLDDRRVRIELVATVTGEQVLGRASILAALA